jgi:predicted PurR-regulated permease PerM
MGGARRAGDPCLGGVGRKYLRIDQVRKGVRMGGHGRGTAVARGWRAGLCEHDFLTDVAGMMSKQLSLYSLLGLLVLIGVLFYRVAEPFLVVLFVGVVLAVLVEPVQRWIKGRLKGRGRIAALITTLAVLVILVLPICLVLLLAGGQMVSGGRELMLYLDRIQPATEADDAGEATVLTADGRVAQGGVAQGVEPDSRASTGMQQLNETLHENRLVQQLVALYRGLDPTMQGRVKNAIADVFTGFVADLYGRTTGLLGNAVRAGIGLFIMVLAVYYFLADGREFMKELRRLLPLEQGEEDELFDQFQSVCRGVVLGTLVAGLAQAGLSCIAFLILGVEQVWLLTVLTMIISFLPFVGAFVIWGPVAIALALNGQTGAAIGLGLFGFFVISTVDNIIRAYVIGGEARLHPLISLVSVLGALQLIGLWGIFIGPMIAALFYSIAHLLRRRILSAGSGQPVGAISA